MKRMLLTMVAVVLAGNFEPAGAAEKVTPRSELGPLAWMVGSWSHDSEGVFAKMSARWVDGGRFLEREFEIKMGNSRMNIRQTIFWDPVKKEIRSWGVSSDGGFEEGRWELKGGEIRVQRAITYHDGKRGKAVNVWRQVNDKRCEVSSVSRSISRKKIPDMAPTELDRDG